MIFTIQSSTHSSYRSAAHEAIKNLIHAKP